jgi:sugar lactone lactonase YvrE
MRWRYFLLAAVIGALAIGAGGALAASTSVSGQPIFNVAGTGTACSTPPACGDGAAATAAQLNFPQGIAVDAAGNTYLADWGDHEIRRIAPNGTIATIAGGGTPCWSPPGCGDGGGATDANLSFPEGVAVGPDGSVYIADTGNNEVRKVSPSGKITRFAGNGSECSQPPACGDGGPATNAQLSAPAAVAVDRSGVVYIVDTGNSELRKVSAAGTISRIAGTGVFCSSAPSCGDGGTATSAQLNYPGGIAIDRAGNLFIADGGDNEVRKVSTTGTIGRVAGTGKACASPPACGDGADAASAQLNGPDGVAVASDGTLYIADAADNELRRVTPAGKIGTVAGTGAECAVPSSCGNGGSATSAQLNYPDAVAVDSSGSVYIADTYDAQLRWLSGATTASLTTPSGRLVLSAFAASVASKAVTVRYALSSPAAVTLSAGSSVVSRAAGTAGFGVLTWNRKLGASTAPRGRYTLTVTASAAGHSASSKLVVRLG